MLSDAERAEFVDAVRVEFERARVEAAWSQRARERAAQLGPFNAGDGCWCQTCRRRRAS